jgi:hypothetical protein
MHLGSEFNDLCIDKQASSDSDPGILPSPTSLNVKTKQITSTARKVRSPTASRSPTVTINSDLYVLEDFRIDEGEFDVGPYSVYIGYDALVYGTLTMNDADGKFDVDQSIYWYAGSATNVTEGDILFEEDFVMRGLSNVVLSNNSVLTANGTGPQKLVNKEDNSVVRFLVNDNTSDTIWFTEGLETLVISDTLQMNSNTAIIVDDDVWIGSMLIVPGTGYVSVKSESLHCDDDMLVYGTVVVEGGNIMVKDAFTLFSSGSITLNGGDMILDRSFSGSEFIILGALNLNDGVFSSVNDGLNFASGSTLTSAANGILRCGGDIKAIHSGSFDLSAGFVEMYRNQPAEILFIA